MTATFWTASAVTFTNGQKTATVTSGSPFNSSQSYANWKLSSGNKNEPVEVKSASGTQIELFDNWSGPSGSTTVTMEPSPASAAAAGAAAQALITQIQTLVNSASVTATANSFVKRDSSGRLKVSAPSANDDAVNKGHLGTAATKNITTSFGLDNQDGEVLKVRDYGIGSRAFFVNNFPNSMMDAVLGGFYYGYSGTHPSATPDSNPFPDKGGAFSAIGFGNNFGGLDYSGQIAIENSNVLDIKAWSIGAAASGGSGWERLYHSGNTNLDTFGGNGAGERFARCTARGTTTAFLELNLNSKVKPSGVIIRGTFKITDASGNTTIATGISNADIGTVTNTRPSSRFYTLLINNLAGLTKDYTYYIETESADAEIEVTF